MQCDSLLLRRLVTEAQPWLIGAGIRDCQAPASGPGLILQLTGPKVPRGLALITHHRYSRWHAIPQVPAKVAGAETHLVMVARQKLNGTVIRTLEQPPGERVLVLSCERRSFTGSSEEVRLVAELMGPDSNLLLLDEEGTIAAAARIAHQYENAWREIRPGKPYLPPPPAGRIPMRVLSLAEWSEFRQQQDPSLSWQRALLSTFSGLTPGAIQAAGAAAAIEPKAPVGELTTGQLRSWAAAIEDLWVEIEAGTRLPPWDEWIPLDLTGQEFHFAVAHLYAAWEDSAVEILREQQWHQALAARRKDLESLRGQFRQDLGRHRGALAERKLGDLIFASLHRFPAEKLGYEQTYAIPDVLAPAPKLPEGDGESLSEAELERLTAPEPPLVEVTIPADKTAAQVAQGAYHRASRGQRGVREVEARLTVVEADLALLATRREEWERYRGMDAVRWQALLKALRQGTAPPPASDDELPTAPAKAAGPLPQALKGLHVFVYKLPDGLVAYVGGNANANEALWRYGEADYLWLHTQGVPGSHVLIPTAASDIPQEAVLAAARLAVSHSSVKEGTKIPVDYTRLRYVKKPPGTAPGYVTYSRERSLRVDPFLPHELKHRRVYP